jgi:hypothetical protein
MPDLPWIWQSHPWNKIFHAAFGLENRQQKRVIRSPRINFQKLKRSLKVEVGCLNMVSLPPAIPQLPDRHSYGSWSHEVSAAHKEISGAYLAARRVLQQESGDVLQLRQHLQWIDLVISPMLVDLEGDQLLRSWAIACAHILSQLMFHLESAALSVEDR